MSLCFFSFFSGAFPLLWFLWTSIPFFLNFNFYGFHFHKCFLIYLLLSHRSQLISYLFARISFFFFLNLCEVTNYIILILSSFPSVSFISCRVSCSIHLSWFFPFVLLLSPKHLLSFGCLFISLRPSSRPSNILEIILICPVRSNRCLNGLVSRLIQIVFLCSSGLFPKWEAGQYICAFLLDLCPAKFPWVMQTGYTSQYKEYSSVLIITLEIPNSQTKSLV